VPENVNFGVALFFVPAVQSASAVVGSQNGTYQFKIINDTDSVIWRALGVRSPPFIVYCIISELMHRCKSVLVVSG
jgi:hypothetical protein